MEIAPELANECMNNYSQIIKLGSLQPLLSSYTASVTYSTKDFAEWLQQNKYLETSTELRISMGVYTDNVAKQVGKPEYTGRLTTFIWPIVDGEAKAPFNVGDLNP